MKERFIIRQPNHVSTAKYTLSALEKNIIYQIIDKLQETMSSDINEIYNEQEIKIEFKQLDKNRNYAQIRKAMSSLTRKQVEFDLVIPKSGKIQRNITSLVSGLKYELYSDHISFMVPSQACTFFCYIGGGFTSLQKTIAISLKSIYAKQFYELCCRWIDRGGYSCSIEKLKELLNITGKYNQISHLRNKVLDVAKEELKQKADLCFSYTLLKNGRKYDLIKIKIYRNTIINKADGTPLGIKEEHYQYVYSFLNRFYPNYEDDKALSYLNALVANQTLDKAFYRFQRLDDEFTTGRKNRENIKNLLKSTILPELTLSNNEITPKKSLV